MEDMYTQAYPNIPNAEEDCLIAQMILQRQYNVHDEDIIEIKNGPLKKCIETYTALLESLEENKSKRILIFHIFTGHGALKDGQ